MHRQSPHPPLLRHADEGSCHHVGEGSDDQQGEQPAEQHEQPAAGLSDVFLNHHADGFSFIFHRGIQRAEILDRAEDRPPMMSHKSTGTQPNTEARIGPVTGPAPAMEEN